MNMMASQLGLFGGGAKALPDIPAVGFVPHAYQVDCLDAIAAARDRGVQRQLAVLATGMGKAQPLRAPVLTPTGWVPMGKLKLGARVIGGDGRPCRVVGVFPQGVKNVYAVTFSDGETVECCGEHLWAVRTKSQKCRGDGYSVRRTTDLIGDLVDGSGAAKWFIPVVGPVEFDGNSFQPIDPYLLGVLLGDGCVGPGKTETITVSSIDPEILEEVRRALPAGMMLNRRGETCDYRMSSGGRKRNPVGMGLKYLGLMHAKSYDKFIPEPYLYGDVACRLAVLQGVLDTDGHITPDGHVELSTTSIRLARDVCSIVRSLGGVTRVRDKAPGRYTHKGAKLIGRESYRVTVTLPGFNPFRLPRKADLYRAVKKQGNTKAITAIRLLRRAECQCIAVDGPDHLYVTTGYTLTHNTVVAALAVERLGLNRMLMLAHRDELLNQGAEKIRAANPGLMVDIDRGISKGFGGYADPRAAVVMGSVQTLGRKDTPRLTRWAPNTFDAIVVDEAHHATAESYLRVLRHFNAGQPGGPLLLGITATPFRGSGKPLTGVFDEVVYEKNIVASIAEGWLCRLRAKRVKTKVDLSNLNVRLGEFSEEELAAAVNTDYRNSTICTAIEEYAADRNAILVFCASLAHVADLTEQLRQRGHSVEGVNQYTTVEDRRGIVERFRNGETRILVNCSIFVEGADFPRIDCVVIGAPTKSTVRYMQEIGRGTRRHPEKTDCLVLDIVDVCGRHEVQTAATAFGLREIDLLGEDILDAKEKCDTAAARGVRVEDGETIADVDRKSDLTNLLARGTVRVSTTAEAVEVFSLVTPSEKVEREARFPWIETGRDSYQLNVDRNLTMTLSRDAIGGWQLQCHGERTSGARFEPSEQVPFEKADHRVRDWAGTFKGKDGEDVPRWRALAMDARWRRDKPSDGQIAQLRNMGIQALPEGLTKGSASQMISYLFARREAVKRERRSGVGVAA